MGSITLFTTSEYEPQAFDAVLFRDQLVVCVRADEDSVRLVPLDKVNHVDGDAESVLVETEIPESFYGGAEYGFADVEQFPDLQAHLEDIESEAY
ncbi:hypothetical protein SAMN05216388_102158 [Halorientalis persicus]|jgi:hypothetical protein|uniref:Uncharacterized protein n=1 Tax=Halorientalis persicus TaxID=1367881 RepID=A0A1H8T758_9EURY|nr:hypothetical protein [Halorientalis persicus]SEO86870.1 hypothetical protein SAMN05216388_102158 [Halorientalis persicus]